jgi:signal transduction histidine kinase
VVVRPHDPDSGYLLMELSDTGCGISPELVGNIFERMYQVDSTDLAGRAGLGLVLHIAKELVDKLGGKIWAESAPDKGSQFCLPSRPTPAKPSWFPWSINNAAHSCCTRRDHSWR